MPSFYKTAFSAYAVKFSPFHGNLVAVGTAQYFGLVGNGKQYVLDLNAPGGVAREVVSFDTQEGVFDCTWSEANEKLLVSATGDGSIKFWDATPEGAQRLQGRPLAMLQGHAKECCSVDWNMQARELLASSGWDGCVKIWDAQRMQNLFSLSAHGGVAYNALWSPARPTMLASVGSDGMLQVFDTNALGKAPPPAGMQGPHGAVTSIKCHETEILALDWNKYNEHQLVTASIDHSIRTWDLRKPNQPLHILIGHRLAVRRVKWSPHHENMIATSSYDLSVCLWDLNSVSIAKSFRHHTEFVCGLDWSLFDEGVICSASWDKTVYAWHAIRDPPPEHSMAQLRAQYVPSVPGAVGGMRPPAAIGNAQQTSVQIPAR